jgi:hypothetical protein
MGNQGPDYKLIPSTVQSNAGQWIPSTVHSNAGQWNHAHFPVVDNPYFNPEETSHYLSSHTEIPGFYSTPIIPEHSWPAGVYNDPGDANWIDTLLNSSQELVGKDVFHEQTDNSQQLNEKFANQFLHLHQLDRDDETDNHFANFDNQPLMPNTYFHRTDPNQDLDFVASLNVSPSSSSYLHPPNLPLDPLQNKASSINFHQLVDRYKRTYVDPIVEVYKQYSMLPPASASKVKIRIGQERPLYISMVPLDHMTYADHTFFIAPVDSDGNVYQLSIFIKNFRELLAEIPNYIQSTNWKHSNPGSSVTALDFDYPELMEWLIEEALSPQNGLPIMGKTEIPASEDLEFSSVQFEIMKLLENPQNVKEKSQYIASIWSTHKINQLGNQPISNGKNKPLFEKSSIEKGRLKGTCLRLSVNRQLFGNWRLQNL